MLFHLSEYLIQFHTGFNAFGYISMRAILGVLTALVICLLVGPSAIERLGRYHIGQTVRDDGPQSHLTKRGTPTMGGALILFSIIVSVLLWADLTNEYIWTALLTMLAFGLIGGIDDYRKLVLQDARGLPARWKYLLQSLVAAVTAVVLYVTVGETELLIPYLKDVSLNLGAFYILLSYFVIVGTSNAVNLTDGLDGLAIMPTVMVAGALGVFAYASGHYHFADYLGIPFIAGAGETVVLCAAMVGAGLGFLWFNTYPAQVFMGDTGALALGAALGTLAVVVQQELVLVIMGGVFVIETVSVIVQVISYKLTGRRVFRMAPLHHHFEQKGWAESTVVIRFWIIATVLALAGLATLKLR